MNLRRYCYGEVHYFSIQSRYLFITILTTARFHNMFDNTYKINSTCSGMEAEIMTLFSQKYRNILKKSNVKKYICNIEIAHHQICIIMCKINV